MHDSRLDELIETVDGAMLGLENHEQRLNAVEALIEALFTSIPVDATRLTRRLQITLRQWEGMRRSPDSQGARWLREWMEIAEVRSRMTDPDGAATQARHNWQVLDGGRADPPPAREPPGSDASPPSAAVPPPPAPGDGPDDPEAPEPDG